MDRNLVLVMVVLISVIDFTLSSPTIPQRSLREIVNKRRQLSYIKSLLQELDDKLERLEKRSCAINLPGMDCDYSDVTGTAKDHDFWLSRMAPGKKRRYSRALRELLQ